MNNKIKEKIREAMNWNTNIRINGDHGEEHYGTKGNGYAKQVCRIEKNIREIVEGDKPLFSVVTEKSLKKKRIHFTKLGKDLVTHLNGDIFELKRHYPYHRFNPYVELLVLHAEGQRHSILSLKEKSLLGDEVIIWVGLANRLVDSIRIQGRSAEFKKEKGDHMRSANKNYRGLVKYIAAQFDRHARMVVLRLDLSYLEEHGWPYGIKGPITPEQFRSNREQLIKSLGKVLFPKSLIGYACKVEYGLEKSFHMHLLVFLDGAIVRTDVTLARIVGEYWEKTITEGKGMHFSCNAVKARYEDRCAIGMIKSDNALALEILKTDIALYLTKTDYYIKLVLNDGGRTFFRGAMPKPRTSNRGRPRAAKLGQVGPHDPLSP